MAGRERAVEGVELGMKLGFYQGKRVLITGHTGFKGSWLAQVLLDAGAEVFGYSLPSPGPGNLYELLGLGSRLTSYYSDIRDAKRLRRVVAQSEPEVVFHLAAQPLVLESYRSPAYTYEVNVMGTVNLLEALRDCRSVTSIVNITTDKVYENLEWEWPYREGDRLNGFDPYSNSKSCSELVTSSFARSYFAERGVPVSTARAGNVIGGGDFAEDRIIPDCIRAALAHEVIQVRNPGSVRPYQHVLEPLSAYLLIAAAQAGDASLAGAYNVGPTSADNVTTAELVEEFCAAWGSDLSWSSPQWAGPHEAGLLRLDSSRIASRLGWQPRWRVRQAVEKVVEWTKAVAADADPATVTGNQIAEYFGHAQS